MELDFEDLAGLWQVLVEQRLEVDWDDLISMYIRVQCVNQKTGQLAKAFYLCRLFQLNRLLYSEGSELSENIELVQGYFRSKDTLFRRLCYLKGLANRIAATENINPIIGSGQDPFTYSVYGKPVSLAKLQRAYKVLCATFDGILDNLLLG